MLSLDHSGVISVSFTPWWINWKWGCSYPLLWWSEQTLLWVTYLWAHERKSAAVSRTRVGGMGKHSSMFPKLIKLFWNSGTSISLLCGVSLLKLREKGYISYWINVAKPPTISGKHTTKWYESSSFLVHYRACALTCKPLIYCPSSLLQIFHHYLKVCTVIFWLKKINTLMHKAMKSNISGMWSITYHVQHIFQKAGYLLVFTNNKLAT